MAAVALGTLGVLTACGGGSDFAEGSVSDIEKAATTDMKALDSVNLEGNVSNSGSEVGLDLSLNTDGDCEGTVELNGASAEIISVGGDSWFKPEEAFWDANTGSKEEADAIKKAVGDHWAKLPSGDSSFSSFCDLDNFLDKIDSKSDSGNETKKGKTEDVDGEEAVTLTQEKDGGTMTAWVATGDKHYILKLEVKGGDSPGSFTFSDFDKKVDVEAPDPSDVVDLSKMAG